MKDKKKGAKITVDDGDTEEGGEEEREPVEGNSELPPHDVGTPLPEHTLQATPTSHTPNNSLVDTPPPLPDKDYDVFPSPPDLPPRDYSMSPDQPEQNGDLISENDYYARIINS